MNTSVEEILKVLIVTDSKHGATREIGDVVKRVLVEAGFEVDHLDADKVEHFGGYDAAVLGSAVYVGHWLPDLRQLIDDNAQTLAFIPVWLFESGPLGDPPVPTEDSVDMLALQRQLSASARSFPGRLDKTLLGRGERIVTRIVRAPFGDFRPIQEIEDWAGSIAVDLKAGHASNGPS